MEMGTERSKQLHNFRMPCDLRWGNQRFLRCMKVDSDGGILPIQRFTAKRGSTNRQEQPRRTIRDRHGDRDKELFSEFFPGSPALGSSTGMGRGSRRGMDEGEDGIAAMREKVMFDLQTAADKMKDAILSESSISIAASVLPQPPADGEGHRQRSTRIRGATSAHKTPIIAAKNKSYLAPSFKSSPTAAADLAYNSPNSEMNERAKFSISLSKKEIEEDFVKIVGRHPPRRPKKRSRIVQKSLDDLFPALWLTEITADKYKVSVTAP